VYVTLEDKLINLLPYHVAFAGAIPGHILISISVRPMVLLHVPSCVARRMIQELSATQVTDLKVIHSIVSVLDKA